MSGACGLAPSAAEKEYSRVTVPAESILKTHPSSLTPPNLVVP